MCVSCFFCNFSIFALTELFFFYPNNLQSRMHVQTHLLHALTQARMHQVCRWSESNAWVNNRVTSTAQRRTRPPSSRIHPSLHVQLSLRTYKTCSLKSKGQQVPANGDDSCPIYVLCTLIGMCQSTPIKIPKRILKEGWSCRRVHKVKPINITPVWPH